MPDVIVIGDGPGGLSAALFLAKNKLDVVVFGQDKTAMNYALLRNYLGIPEILGPDRAVARSRGKRCRALAPRHRASAYRHWSAAAIRDIDRP
jgi:thioredoxin reductase